MTDLSSAAVGHHGDGGLDAQGLSLPVAQSLHFPLKLRPSDQTWLTCTQTRVYTLTNRVCEHLKVQCVKFVCTIFLKIKNPTLFANIFIFQ